MSLEFHRKTDLKQVWKNFLLCFIQFFFLLNVSLSSECGMCFSVFAYTYGRLLLDWSSSSPWFLVSTLKMGSLNCIFHDGNNKNLDRLESRELSELLEFPVPTKKIWINCYEWVGTLTNLTTPVELFDTWWVFQLFLLSGSPSLRKKTIHYLYSTRSVILT